MAGSPAEEMRALQGARLVCGKLTFMEQGLALVFRNLKFAEQSLSLLFQKLGFAEHQTFAPNTDEDQAKVLLLTSCYQEVGSAGVDGADQGGDVNQNEKGRRAQFRGYRNATRFSPVHLAAQSAPGRPYSQAQYRSRSLTPSLSYSLLRYTLTVPSVIWSSQVMPYSS
jgi:hypothetical protein